MRAYNCFCFCFLFLLFFFFPLQVGTGHSPLVQVKKEAVIIRRIVECSSDSIVLVLLTRLYFSSYHSLLFCGQQGACWPLKGTIKQEHLHSRRVMGVFWHWFLFLLTRMYTLIFPICRYRLAIVHMLRFFRFDLSSLNPTTASRHFDCFYCIAFPARYNTIVLEDLTPYLSMVRLFNPPPPTNHPYLC